VLAATLEELGAHGLEGLSVDRVARAAEVNKTTVYRRWPTKEALIAAALERLLVDVNLQLSETGSLEEDLLAVGEFVAGLLSRPTGRALARAAMAESTAPAISAMASRQLEQQAVGPVARMVTRAVQRGQWREDVDPRALLGMLVGAILHRSMLERQPATGAWLRTITNVLVMGVAPRHR
jgi:AcrR family transcriptional regulator